MSEFITNEEARRIAQEGIATPITELRRRDNGYTYCAGGLYFGMTPEGKIVIRMHLKPGSVTMGLNKIAKKAAPVKAVALVGEAAAAAQAGWVELDSYGRPAPRGNAVDAMVARARRR